jgi:hypothetical protein
METDMKCKCGGILVEIFFKVLEGNPKKAVKCSACGRIDEMKG